MKLGDTGNGFDFQIKPYSFGGNPAAVTSVPYPVLSSEVLDARVEGAFDIELVQNLEQFDVTSQALSGEMRDLLRRYYEGPEEIDPTTPVILSASMAQILKRTYQDDEYDAVMATALYGDMRRILIVINVEPDSFDGVTAVALSGTMN